MSIALGNIDFNVVDIQPKIVAEAFQVFLERGSRITGVSLDSISTAVVKIPANGTKPNLADLLSVGMKLFDAVVWITAGRPTSHPLKENPAMKSDTIPKVADIAKSLVYCFFFLLTQARYPTFSAENDAELGREKAPKVPNFLEKILGMREDQSHYVTMLTSFPPEQFNPVWIKHVRFENFGQELMARFGLGVAGYRMFAPFKLYTPKESMSDDLRNAFAFARAVAEHEPTWDVHPTTRNPAVLTARGNLNKNLGNLILECFDDAQITEMIDSRVLYGKPVRDANHRNYKTWAAGDNISGNDAIFHD